MGRRGDVGFAPYVLEIGKVHGRMADESTARNSNNRRNIKEVDAKRGRERERESCDVRQREKERENYTRERETDCRVYRVCLHTYDGLTFF